MQMRLNRQMADINALRDHLVAAARQAAYPVIDASARDDVVDVWMVIVQAGMAAEFVLRAVVADLSPGLLFLTSTKHAETIAALRSNEPPTQMLDARSIPAREVTALASAAHPTIRAVQSEAATVASLRDSVVHMFAFEPSDQHRAVEGLLRVVDAAAPCIGLSADDFWGEERSALAKELRQRDDEATLYIVARKIRAATLTYESLRRSMTEPQFEELLQTRQKQLPMIRVGEYIEVHDCPACTHPVMVIRRTTDLSPHTVDGIELDDWGPDGVPRTALFPQIVIHQQMTCTICGLSLSGDELARAIPATDNPWDVEPRRAPIEEYEAAMSQFDPPF